MTVSSESSDELVAFLDANIVLEGKPLAELPWTEIITAGLIHVLIVPKAMDEIDAKKRDGRLGPHARAFNRLIAPSVINGEPIVLRDADPRVELQMATCSRIPWNDYDELDPDDGDSRIVAEALNVRNVASRHRILISHDIKPLAYARGRDLPVHQASDAWLRGPEPSPKDKEIHRLKQQVAEYRKDEPTFEISIEVSDVTPPIIYQVTTLDTEQADALTELIRNQNPKKLNGNKDRYGDSLGFVSNHDSSYDGKYSAFINREVPSFVAKFSEKLELLFNQRLLRVRVTNAGDIRADNLVVSIKTSDGWINRRVVFLSPRGPAAPVPRPGYLSSLDIHRHLKDMIPSRVGRHEFETTLHARRSGETKAICEDFHSGQTYYFEGVIAATSSDRPLEIIVTLTAKNLRGEHTKTFKLDKEIVVIEPGELVDLQTLELKQNYPTSEELARLLRAQEYDEIEWDEKNEN
ncbi:PIN domain-containing protein [Pararhizobium mangrovi]|uniref:PIN domain-containing protein n=1 Tax=Pararhizobium mangrovi TaxID=2590452 RepID=A0A506TYN6_9HYPH|nr:hypothetical protein [Pararhizobium mangrovi]TPW25835.1 hypothetical protein FJU11_17555 [Pararhizobium mangrovi]